MSVANTFPIFGKTPKVSGVTLTSTTTTTIITAGSNGTIVKNIIAAPDASYSSSSNALNIFLNDTFALVTMGRFVMTPGMQQIVNNGLTVPENIYLGAGCYMRVSLGGYLSGSVKINVTYIDL